MALNVFLNGSEGRMGKAIQAVAPTMDTTIIGATDSGEIRKLNSVEWDVLIDFSIHTATLPVVEWAVEHNKAVVIGTTGHTEEERAALKMLAQKIPVVWAGNFSVGVNLLFYLSNKAARILDKNYHPEIVEMHHRHKVDAPSGTAERLLEVVREARGLSEQQVKHGRHGLPGARPDDEIGMHTLRGGDVVGDHTVIFAGDGERFELSHKASDRKIFAQGALKAAHWVADQPPGLYSMEDVLKLR